LVGLAAAVASLGRARLPSLIVGFFRGTFWDRTRCVNRRATESNAAEELRRQVLYPLDQALHLKA
jgi:hypothetical protein